MINPSPDDYHSLGHMYSIIVFLLPLLSAHFCAVFFFGGLSFLVTLVAGIAVWIGCISICAIKRVFCSKIGSEEGENQRKHLSYKDTVVTLQETHE
ncbi:hypothetical protein GDO81_027765 [Engystomops pustulosus]|uniref:Uncharacterized protein n=1 Tax=Engystomops pustulosus TaxID=76066 RepID=A0AAV6YP50_ENGPU|nr:hypothetical protein GDO81_027765 [Engystomops pustulosus]